MFHLSQCYYFFLTGRCGSLIVDLTLEFSIIFTEKSVLTILQEATKDGKLGEFSVNASSIIGTRPVIASTTMPPISRTTPTVSDSKLLFLLLLLVQLLVIYF